MEQINPHFYPEASDAYLIFVSGHIFFRSSVLAGSDAAFLVVDPNTLSATQEVTGSCLSGKWLCFECCLLAFGWLQCLVTVAGRALTTPRLQLSVSVALLVGAVHYPWEEKKRSRYCRKE